jgi:hypothetical protein
MIIFLDHFSEGFRRGVPPPHGGFIERSLRVPVFKEKLYVELKDIKINLRINERQVV